MAMPIKTLELHYPMIQFLITVFMLNQSQMISDRLLPQKRVDNLLSLLTFAVALHLVSVKPAYNFHSHTSSRDLECIHLSMETKQTCYADT